MHILPLSFALLTYAGYWRPVDWPPKSLKYRAYCVYTVVMILMLNSFAFCGIVDCFMLKNLETYVEKWSIFISVFGVCCKVINLIIYRGKIIGLANMLLKDICLPKNNHETDIQRRFDNNAKKITIYCEIINELAVFFATVAKLWSLINTRSLPLYDWVPYSISSTAAYGATVMHQTIGLMVCANSSVAHETLVAGFMIQACAQLDILCHRVRKLPDSLSDVRRRGTSRKNLKAREQQLIHELVHHHSYIYKYAERVNIVFALVIFLQFTISSTVLCLSIYKLSTKSLLSFDFAWSLSYLGSMFLQIYLYCWFGNEVTLKSVEIGDAVYEMDWTTLPTDTMKSLLVIIMRCKRPITLTSGHMIALSNESFAKIVRISYSVYNVLKT